MDIVFLVSCFVRISERDFAWPSDLRQVKTRWNFIQEGLDYSVMQTQEKLCDSAVSLCADHVAKYRGVNQIKVSCFHSL